MFGSSNSLCADLEELGEPMEIHSPEENKSAPRSETPMWCEQIYPPALLRRKQRIAVGYKNCVNFNSNDIFQHGRRGLWTSFEQLAANISVRLGIRAFGLQNPTDVPNAADVKGTDTLFVCCEFLGHISEPFTAIYHVELPHNRDCRDVLQRWEVTDSTRRSNWLSIGSFNKCIMRLDDDEVYVNITFEVTIYMEKATEASHVKYYGPQIALRPEMSSKVYFRLYSNIPDSPGPIIAIERVLVAAESHYLKAFFINRACFKVETDKEDQALRIILRYIQFKLVPRSDQITRKLLSMIVIFRMLELQRICLQILHPIRTRNVRLGHCSILEMCKLIPNVFDKTMFDLLLPNGRFPKNVSMSALTMSSLSINASGRDAETSSSSKTKLRVIKYGHLENPLLLAPNLLKVILGTDNPPLVPSKSDATNKKVHKPLCAQYSTDGSDSQSCAKLEASSTGTESAADQATKKSRAKSPRKESFDRKSRLSLSKNSAGSIDGDVEDNL